MEGLQKKILWGTIIFIALLVYVWGADRPLRDGESKYAEIPREILVTGEWLTPHLDYVRYFTKPPLTFWITAIGYKLFGVNEVVARVPNTLFALVCALLSGILGERVLKVGIGPLTTWIFLLITEVYVFCLDASIELALVASVLASILFFWRFYETGQNYNLLLYYFFMGIGFLAKGILGIALPLSTVLAFLVISDNCRYVWKLVHPFGIFILFSLTAPWVIYMSAKHGDFISNFFLYEHIKRLFGKGSPESIMPTVRFYLLALGQFFPWTMYLPHAVFFCVTESKINRAVLERVLYISLGAAVPLVLFSLSKSKTEYYTLHLFPYLAIFVGWAMYDLIIEPTRKKCFWWGVPWLAVAVISFCSLGFLWAYQNTHMVEALAIPSISNAKIFLTVEGVMAIMITYLFFNRRVKLILVGISVFMLALFATAFTMSNADFPNHSMKFAADIYNRVASENDLLFSDELPEFAHIGTLVFYTGKPAFLLRDRIGSKLYFTQKDKMSRCYDEEGFVALVRDNRKNIYLVGKRDKTIRRLERLGLSYEILGNGGDKALFLVHAVSSGMKVGRKYRGEIILSEFS